MTETTPTQILREGLEAIANGPLIPYGGRKLARDTLARADASSSQDHAPEAGVALDRVPSMVTMAWHSQQKRLYPLHKPELVEKAIRMANWRDNRHAQVFLAKPLTFEDEPGARPGQRIWFCRALEALTREEVLSLYDSLVAGTKWDDETGRDFTPPDVREQLPHIYQSKTAPDAVPGIPSNPTQPQGDWVLVRDYKAPLADSTLSEYADGIIANIEAVPGWEDSRELVTAHCHATCLRDDPFPPRPVSEEVVERMARAHEDKRRQWGYLVEPWDTLRDTIKAMNISCMRAALRAMEAPHE